MGLLASLQNRRRRSRVKRTQSTYSDSYCSDSDCPRCTRRIVRSIDSRPGFLVPMKVPNYGRQRRITHPPNWNTSDDSPADRPDDSLVSLENLGRRLQKRRLADTPAYKPDNFYTPENKDFYEKSPYMDLDSKRREIRLLKVFPRNTYNEHIKNNPQWADPSITTTPMSDLPDMLIACELVDKVPLSRVDGNYCALSYCAGKMADPKVILIDGIPFKAFANLEHAMGQLLGYWTTTYPGKDLFLWADQVCINQGNHTERSSQVGLMPEIYRRSSKTFICLSNPELDRCLSWVSPIVSSSADADGELLAISRMKRYLRNVLGLLHSQPNGKRGQSQIYRWLSSLQAFMASPWWRRAWVYQEFIVSPWPNFLSGSDCIPWYELSHIMNFIFSDLDTFLTSLMVEVDGEAKIEAVRKGTAKQLTHDKAWNHTLEQRREEDRRMRMLEDERKRKQDRDMEKSQEQERKQVVDNRRKVPLLNKPLTREKDRTSTFNPQRWKFYKQQRSEGQRTELQQRTNPQMKKPDRMIQTEHSPDFCETQGRTTQRKTLSRLSRNPENSQKLTARQYRSVAAEQFLRRSSEYEPSRRQHATNHTDLPGSYSEDWHKKKAEILFLQSQLRELDSLSVMSVCRGKNNAGRSQCLTALLQHSRNCDSSDPRDRVYAFLGLAYKEYGIVPDYSPKNSVAHALIHACRRIIEHDKNLKVLEHVHRGRERLGHFLPTWVPDWTSKEIDYELAGYLTSQRGGGQEDKLFNASKGLCTEWVEFRNDEENGANMDLKVRGILVGILDKLEGLVSGFPGLGRFLTFGNQRVIAPKSALVDDEVWVLHGASKPVVLRHDDDMYSFLGEVLVCELDGQYSDVMYGQMIELANQDMAETKEIWLV